MLGKFNRSLLTTLNYILTFFYFNLKDGLTTGEIVGIVLGSIGVLLIVVALITLLVCCVRKSKNDEINLNMSMHYFIDKFYLSAI